LFLRTDPRLSVAPGVFTRKDADAGYLARGELSDLANGPKGFTMKPLCVCASFGSMKPNTYSMKPMKPIPNIGKMAVVVGA